MTQIKTLLELRKQMKSKKPDFIRQDIRKKARLKIKWRKPRGLDSKIRRKLSGRAKPVSQGYRSPKNVRGLHKSGLRQSLVTTRSDLDKLSPKENCLVISASLGNKKRIEILKKAKEKGFEIVNINDPEYYIKKVEDTINLRKKSKQETNKKQEIAGKKKEKKTADARTESGTPQESIPRRDTHTVGKEDKKEMEKKEKDKLLTKKGI